MVQRCYALAVLAWVLIVLAWVVCVILMGLTLLAHVKPTNLPVFGKQDGFVTDIQYFKLEQMGTGRAKSGWQNINPSDKKQDNRTMTETLLKSKKNRYRRDKDEISRWQSSKLSEHYSKIIENQHTTSDKTRQPKPRRLVEKLNNAPGNKFKHVWNFHDKNWEQESHHKNENGTLKEAKKHDTDLDSMSSIIGEDSKISNSTAINLVKLLTLPTASCRKMVRVGGRSCIGAYDGSKLVCLDRELSFRPDHCLVYSFGVGHDFTFDEHMQDAGCEVHSWDHDSDHEQYDHRIGPTAYFHKARIGPRTGLVSYCDEGPRGLTDNCEPPILYQTLEDIRRSLDHKGRVVDYLKMDIEGGEWEVLRQALDHPTSRSLIAATSQLSLEIHLEEIRNKKTVEERDALLATYLDTLQDLRSLGLHVLAYEENELNPQYEEVAGVQLALYAEVLFVNTSPAREVLI